MGSVITRHGDTKPLATSSSAGSQVADPGSVQIVELAPLSEVPSVSVVVPTFESRQLALAALDALSRQQDVSFEVVVVDDGSTDGSFGALAQRATELGLAGRIVQLSRNQGRGAARNVGVKNARAGLIAFTDADCLPEPNWLRACVDALAPARVGIVQGPTRPCPEQAHPLFSHFMHIEHLDGTFSTCNVLYRKEALLAAGGFDQGISYWEDLDLGWRARRAGWDATFAADALVYHQVIPLSPSRWLRWPLHYACVPAASARYPEYRRHLFLRVWVHWFHALLDLALLSVPLATLVHRGFLVLALPYVLAFPVRHGLRGRWPPVKAAFHLAWDVVSFLTLLVSSLRHRSPVF